VYNILFLYYGILTILTQLIVFRELSVLFLGNELFLGTFLSSWLFWVGLGSFSAGRLLKKGHSPEAYFSYAFLSASFLFPTLILLIRATRGILPFGEFIGPFGTVFYTFGIMSALCFVIGVQFSIACLILPGQEKTGARLGRVYMYEALGAVIGGAIFTYALIGKVPTFIMTLALSIGCVASGIVLLVREISLKKMSLIFLALVLLSIAYMVEPAVNRVEWKGYTLRAQKEARNGTLSFVSMGSIKSVFIDGILSASFPDPEGYEPPAHWPMLASPDPERILILGDASLGEIKEVLKHRPGSIDYVALDESFLEMVKPYLDREDISAINHPITHIHYADPRSFVRRNKGSYDVVIINISEVPNLKTNRFFTEEFYAEVNSILKPDGILASSVASSENYLSPQTRAFNASVYFTLRSVFKTVEVIPGDTVTFLSSQSPVDMQKTTILRRFEARGLANHYVIPSYIEYKLETKRRTELKAALEGSGGVEINKDFRPTTCYYFANFWLNKFASSLGYLAISVVFIAISAVIYRKRGSLFSILERKEAIIVFVLGFVGILLELTLLLAYQVISGYVYWQMGVLFASFMSGLFLGSYSGNQFRRSSRNSLFLALIILSLAVAGLSAGAAYILPRLTYLSIFQNMAAFTSALAVIGAITGAAFVIAGFFMKQREVAAGSGGLYAADLWGAALGAILSTNFIVPVFGISGALKASFIIALAGLAAFLVLSAKDNL